MTGIEQEKEELLQLMKSNISKETMEIIELVEQFTPKQIQGPEIIVSTLGTDDAE